MTPTADEPNGRYLRFRLDKLEDEVKELQRGQPAVMAERVTRLTIDVNNLRGEMNTEMSGVRDELRSMKRIQASVFSGLGIVIAGAVIAAILQGGA